MDKVTDLESLARLRRLDHSLLLSLISSEISSDFGPTPLLDALYVADTVNGFVDTVSFSGPASIINDIATIEISMAGDVFAEW